MARDFQALFAEAAARVMELERENDALAQDNAQLTSRVGRFCEVDDGSYAYYLGGSGGAHPAGLNGELIIAFVDACGVETRRTYIAKELQTDAA